MQDAHPGGLDSFCPGGRGGLLFADGEGRHGCSLLKRYRNIRSEPDLRYCHACYQFHARSASWSQKSEPGRPGSPPVAHPVRGCWARGLFYDAGISTVSTTWITPFDWLTFEIVTIEVPPLASTIQTLPSWCLTVSCSPSAVFSFLPSVRSEAASLPGTTW